MMMTLKNFLMDNWVILVQIYSANTLPRQDFSTRSL